MKDLKIYAVRDMETGKLVSDLTNPKKKFWQRKDSATDAINKASHRTWYKNRTLKLVTFKLVEVDDDETN